jgi:Tfp pilus assembly protein PilV
MQEMQPSTSFKLPKENNSKAGIWILIALLVVALGVIGWLVWQYMTLSQQNTNLRNENAGLQNQINELSAKSSTPEESSSASALCDPTVTADLKANIADAISSGNTAALEGYMDSTVNVIVAASEGVGPRTPSEAIADLAYLEGGADPWDFNVDAGTIATWDAGFYTDYFDDNTYAGRAANGMVVVFDFNECGKINEVFMVANEELLL